MKINLFSLGDCTNISTWLGLPYYFYHSLLGQSIDVRPIDLDPSGSMAYEVLNRLTSARDRVARLFRSGGGDVARTWSTSGSGRWSRRIATSI